MGKTLLNEQRRKKFKTYARKEQWKILLKKMKYHPGGKAVSQNDTLLTVSKQEKFSQSLVHVRLVAFGMRSCNSINQ